MMNKKHNRVLERAILLAVFAVLSQANTDAARAQITSTQTTEVATTVVTTTETTAQTASNQLSELPAAPTTTAPSASESNATSTSATNANATNGAVATTTTSATQTSVEEQLSLATPVAAVALSPAPPNFAAGLADLRREQSAVAEEIDLESALALALQFNPQRTASLANVRAAQARIGTARSAGGAQVGLSAGANLDRAFGTPSLTSVGTGGGGTGGGGGGTGGVSSGGGSQILGFNSTQSVGVNAQIPIYNGGRVKASTRVAEAGADSLAAQERQIEQDLVLNTTLNYLNILRSDELLQVAESNVGVSVERRRIAQVRFDAGAAARLEVLRAQTILSDAEQRRATASATLAQSRASLNTIIGRAPEAPIRVQQIQSLQLNLPLIDGAISSPILRQTAETTRPILDASRSQVRVSEANIEVARAQRKPNLGLDLGAFLRNPVSFAGRFALSIGLGLSQNLFDSGRSRSQISEAQALLDQSRSNLGSQQLFVANQIEQSLLSLDSAQARATSASSSVEEAQEALRAAQLGFSAGVRTSLDVSDAQVQLLTAQTNTVNARYDVAQ